MVRQLSENCGEFVIRCIIVPPAAVIEQSHTVATTEPELETVKAQLKTTETELESYKQAASAEEREKADILAAEKKARNQVRWASIGCAD